MIQTIKGVIIISLISFYCLGQDTIIIDLKDTSFYEENHGIDYSFFRYKLKDSLVDGHWILVENSGNFNGMDSAKVFATGSYNGGLKEGEFYQYGCCGYYHLETYQNGLLHGPLVQVQRGPSFVEYYMNGLRHGAAIYYGFRGFPSGVYFYKSDTLQDWVEYAFSGNKVYKTGFGSKDLNYATEEIYDSQSHYVRMKLYYSKTRLIKYQIFDSTGRLIEMVEGRFDKDKFENRLDIFQFEESILLEGCWRRYGGDGEVEFEKCF